MDDREALKIQLSELMHELFQINQRIFEQDDYSNLLSLCEKDITILDMLSLRENCTAKQLSVALNLPKTTVVTAISRLVKRGYLIRSQNMQDKREQFLQLTDKGKRANLEHHQYEALFLESIMDLWKEEDQKALAEIIKRREHKR